MSHSGRASLEVCSHGDVACSVSFDKDVEPSLQWRNSGPVVSNLSLGNDPKSVASVVPMFSATFPSFCFSAKFVCTTVILVA